MTIFKMKPGEDASFSRRLSGLSVCNANPPASSRWLFSELNLSELNEIFLIEKQRLAARVNPGFGFSVPSPNRSEIRIDNIGSP